MDFAHVSRYVSEIVKSPHPGTHEKLFIDFLVSHSSGWKDAIIFDTNDDVSVALSKNKSILERHFKIPTPEWDTLKKLINKTETYKIAAECDVPHPKTVLPKSTAQLHEIKKEIAFPCILKPFIGHRFFTEFGQKNFKINQFDELISKFELCLKSGHEMMLQEIIPGPDSNIYQCFLYVNEAGYTSTAFHIRKIRQNPPQFGVARVAISEALIPELTDWTTRILRQIRFTGLVHSEFKKDPRDNTFKLIEINGRLSRSNWLATHCGVNLPWIAYMDLTEKKNVEISAYKKNVYWIEILKDISNSMLHHRKEDIAVMDYIHPYFSKSKTFADFSKEDYKPFFKRIGNYVVKAALGK